MEQIIEAFGIDWRLISIQIFNFMLLAVALWYFLYTPVLAMIRERQEKIEKGVRDAEAAQKSLEAADSEKKEILTAAHSKAESTISRAAAHAKEKSSEIIDSANKRADDMLKNAEAEAKTMREAVVRESEAEIAKIAVLAAEKILREESKTTVRL